MLVNQKTGATDTPAVPPGLSSWYSIIPFTDTPSGRRYWVAVEKQADANGRSLKVWYGHINIDIALALLI